MAQGRQVFTTGVVVAASCLLLAGCSLPGERSLAPEERVRSSLGEGATVAGGATPSIVFTDSLGVTTSAVSEAFSFSYGITNGVAMRGAVPVPYPASPSDQVAIDTLDYFLPSSAHQVALLPEAALYPPGDTVVINTVDSAGTSIAMKVLSGRRPNGSWIPCLDDGCPPGEVLVYENGTLASRMQLDWNVGSGAYTLRSSVMTLYDPDGSVRASMTTPVTYEQSFGVTEFGPSHAWPAFLGTDPTAQLADLASALGGRELAAQTYSSEECRRAVQHARQAVSVARTAVRTAASRPSIASAAVAVGAVAYAAAASAYAAHACAPPGSM